MFISSLPTNYTTHFYLNKTHWTLHREWNFITTETEMNNQSFPPIFRCAAEIRRDVYDLVFDYRGLMTNGKRLRNLQSTLRDGENFEYRCLNLKPYSNNFALTCRQAYQETRHLWYMDSFFHVGTPETLEKLVRETRPENLELIEELDVNWLEAGAWLNLKPFQGLMVLHAVQSVPGSYVPRATGQHPRRNFLRAFVALVRHLPHLQRISIRLMGSSRRIIEQYVP